MADWRTHLLLSPFPSLWAFTTSSFRPRCFAFLHQAREPLLSVRRPDGVGESVQFERGDTTLYSYIRLLLYVAHETHVQF